jgi:hypothetical protein
MTDAPERKTEDKWRQFRYFIGKWQGTGTGQPGVSRSERQYKWILNGQFIWIHTRSVFQPQEKNPQGEIHEDIGLLGYDEARETHILREFHGEGYVNQYVVESWDQEGGILVMITEAIENLSPGWRARTTYEIRNEDEFRETFDLAEPGKDWVCCITHDFKRVSKPD